MTIEKGQAWGEPGRLPDDGVVVRSNAEANAVVTAARRERRPIPVLGLLGGDLAHTMGATGDEARLRSDDALTVPVDLGSVLVDGRLHWFVAHLVVRHLWWQGRFVVAMNADHLGPMVLAPRAHPNDGLLDVVDGRLGVDDRLKARRLVRTGDHLPHPDISVRRTSATQVELDRSTPVRIDGITIGTARTLSLRIEPDALTCVI
ncbi:MAG: hypothetical protein JJE52_16890 [Acidimicrobiia bacterium]|nr:hypothetical protein [Acidimicrobiia bacterium]